MKTYKLALALALVLSVCLLAQESQASGYWVSFSGTGGTFKYLMKIDANGNILVPPTAVLSWPQDPEEELNPFGEDGQPLEGTSVTALSPHSATQIKMWITRPDSHLSSLIINKSTLHVDSFKKNENNAFFADVFWSLQATQRASNNFLSIIRGAKSIYQNDNVWRGNQKGFMLTSTNLYAGSTTRLSPRTDGHAKHGTVSPDGLMSVVNVEVTNFDSECCAFDATDNDAADKIYAQPLSSNATPVGDPFVVGQSGDQVGAVDVSNPIGSKRFVVFNKRSNDVPDTQNGDALILQQIDAVTGAKIAGPRALQEDVEMVMTFMQGVAVAPDGAFVLFTRRPENSVTQADPDQVANRDTLYYLKLDNNGFAVGDPIELFSPDDGAFTGEDDEGIGIEGGAYPQIIGVDVLAD